MALVLVVCNASAEKVPTYLNADAPLEARVEDALARMTLEEKVKVLHAQSKFSSAGVPRLGIPELWTSDGPHGVRAEVLWNEWDSADWSNDSCTAFPALTCLAATWRPSLAYDYGRAVGEEARYRGKDVLLGPGVNMMRTPLCGRNFEYLGEDPLLASVMVVPYVRGVQSNNVAACVKHFALNNNEKARDHTEVHVSDRALREIYLPAFEAAVKDGGAWSLMASYNLYKGDYCCENPVLIKDILKGEWGFDGVVVSDWGGVHDTDKVLRGGLDLEMGTGTNGLTVNMNEYDAYRLANPYLERLKDGRASETELNDHVRRLLRLIFRTSMAPTYWQGRFTCPEHSATARKIGGEGIVLLKNDGILPLDTLKEMKILLVGENAAKMLAVGGGSSSLKVSHEVSPLEGISMAFPNASTDWERGYIGVGSSTCGKIQATDVAILTESRSPEALVADALKAAREADVVVFVGGLNKEPHMDAEGDDRESLELPYGQEMLIEKLADVNPNLVVVNISGSPVAMSWADRAKAIVQHWYIGSESGNALADVLSGRVNPSGKLPFSIPYRLEDTPTAGERRYPGIRRADGRFFDAYYDEDILIGYRWYDTMRKPVQFPFGYGLSYTGFRLSDAVLDADSYSSSSDSITVKVNVANTGSRDGAEVVQVYASAPRVKGQLREAKKLVGFRKVDLKAGEKKPVEIVVPLSSLAYYDEAAADWKTVSGKYRMLVGTSAADTPCELKFTYR